MKKTKLIMDKLLEIITIMSLFCLIAVVLLQVLARFILPQAPVWTEELARVLFIYSTSFSAGLAVREGAYVSVDLISKMLAPSLQLYISIIIKIIIASFMMLISYYAIEFVKIGNFQTSPALQIRTFYFYLAILIGPLFIGIYYLVSLVELILTNKFDEV
ncbi:MAG: C4-dicarboxylate ABC transporter permease [Candidatus Marinimicrobia bacterium]|nr:C4-dicarboxylate ABC transporter permease [Candidatus Neomarinimicrobiota bacterium]|tara:strand:- start:3008 stop:3487 length:480 start_codon:yes stop_codon:yes gene_type:complete